jgi:hypothetical protein
MPAGMDKGNAIPTAIQTAAAVMQWPLGKEY